MKKWNNSGFWSTRYQQHPNSLNLASCLQCCKWVESKQTFFICELIMYVMQVHTRMLTNSVRIIHAMIWNIQIRAPKKYKFCASVHMYIQSQVLLAFCSVLYLSICFYLGKSTFNKPNSMLMQKKPSRPPSFILIITIT